MRDMIRASVKMVLDAAMGGHGAKARGHLCPACGRGGELTDGAKLWPELIAEWELTPEWAEWFNLREGSICEHCGSNLRSRQLAQTIVETARAEFGTTASSLRKLCRERTARSLRVAEINSVGSLHQFLAKLPCLNYSEYRSELPGIPSEDLMGLSYGDSTFDLVITSDTLEHVPDVGIALGEIRRVLKRGGLHLFTVPVVWARPRTRRRATVRDGKLVHDMAPSYHGSPQQGKDDFLVFYEFGADFVEQCQEAGFEVELVRDDQNPTLVTFVTRRVARFDW